MVLANSRCTQDCTGLQPETSACNCGFQHRRISPCNIACLATMILLSNDRFSLRRVHRRCGTFASAISPSVGGPFLPFNHTLSRNPLLGIRPFGSGSDDRRSNHHAIKAALRKAHYSLTKPKLWDRLRKGFGQWNVSTKHGLKHCQRFRRGRKAFAAFSHAFATSSRRCRTLYMCMAASGESSPLLNT